MIFSGVFVAWAGGFILLGFFASEFFTSVSFFGFDSLQNLLGIETVALSIAVWVGFLALFGIATDGGVVMATYLQQRFKEFNQKNQNEWRQMANKPELVASHIQHLRMVGVEAATKRIRPTMLTTATTIFALLPLFSSMGKGSEIMVPMAIPTFRGNVCPNNHAFCCTTFIHFGEKNEGLLMRSKCMFLYKKIDRKKPRLLYY